jgi:hypothetical protein
MAEPTKTANTQATQGLPPIVLPSRLAGKARSVTKTSGYSRSENLRRDDRVDPNRSIQQMRQFQTAAAQMRALAEANGLASTAVVSTVAMAMSGWRVEVYQTWTNEFSHEGLLATETILSGLDTLWNYTSGYQDKRTLDQVIETALLEAVLTGGVAAELILDSSRIPQSIVLFPYESITWKADGKGGRFPSQKDNDGNDVELNVPNIWVAEVFKQATRLYTLPMMHSGVQQLFQYTSFIEDMSRVLRRNGQPRTLAKLNYDMVVQAAPPELKNDPNKLANHLEQVRASVEQLLAQLEPEDALVYYDIAEMDSMRTDGEKADYSTLLSELAGLTASAMKSNASALGLRIGGSQNVSSTEALLAMKLARLIQVPVEVVLSRALTLALRLYGIDAYVEFKFEDIDLRPKVEIEAHLTMRQARVLELLSLGMLTDDEAQVMLSLGSKPEGSPELSGTMFYGTKQLDTLPASGTNAVNQQIDTDQPTSGGGRDNTKRV